MRKYTLVGGFGYYYYWLMRHPKQKSARSMEVWLSAYFWKLWQADQPTNHRTSQSTNQSTDVRGAHCENVVKVLKFRAKITCTHKKKTVRCHFIIFFKSKMCIVLLSLTLLGLNIIFLQIDHRLVTESETYLDNFTGVTIRNQILIPTKINVFGIFAQNNHFCADKNNCTVKFSFYLYKSHYYI